MFKADQVEQLKSELEGGAADAVDLGTSDSGGLIGLVDSGGGPSGTGITMTEADTGGSSSAGMRMKDDTALAADLGLSGSMGGVPSPGRPASSGTGLSGTATGRQSGINVFGAEDVERVDPSAQTAITGAVREQVNLEGVGSGSGLLDLTRESDDTSLGAVLDEIAPSARLSPSDVSDVGSGSGTGLENVSISAPSRGGSAVGAGPGLDRGHGSLSCRLWSRGAVRGSGDALWGVCADFGNGRHLPAGDHLVCQAESDDARAIRRWCGDRVLRLRIADRQDPREELITPREPAIRCFCF